MTPWRGLFDLNETIVLFVYGQVFFVLGLAIFWQSRRHSRLDLARILGWLGTFGLLHGIHEWGDIFIPIQAEYLNPAWIDVLLMLQLFLLAFSFAAIFQFGAESMAAVAPKYTWLRAMSAGLLLAWMTAFLWASQVSRWGAAQSLIYANVWARYLLAFPGALLAAWGLRRQTQRFAQYQAMQHIAGTFRTASIALVLYAIFAGLIVPPAPFFPANIINSAVVLDALGVPVQVWRSLVGLLLLVSIVRGLEIFNVEVDQRIEEIERRQILMTERERIGRELHDGAIQTVYTAGLLAESVHNKMAEDDPLAKRLDTVVSALQHAIVDLRQFIVELEPGAPTADLAKSLNELAEDPRLRTLVEVEASTSGLAGALLSPSRTTHVLAIVNEALSNVTRHARARHAWIEASRQNGQLRVTISDDGVGITGVQGGGFGLRNMRDRARLLGGQLDIEPRVPRGTRVVLTTPWEESR